MSVLLDLPEGSLLWDIRSRREQLLVSHIER